MNINEKMQELQDTIDIAQSIVEKQKDIISKAKTQLKKLTKLNEQISSIFEDTPIEVIG